MKRETVVPNAKKKDNRAMLEMVHVISVGGKMKMNRIIVCLSGGTASF